MSQSSDYEFLLDKISLIFSGFVDMRITENVRETFFLGTNGKIFSHKLRDFGILSKFQAGKEKAYYYSNKTNTLDSSLTRFSRRRETNMGEVEPLPLSPVPIKTAKIDLRDKRILTASFKEYASDLLKDITEFIEGNFKDRVRINSRLILNESDNKYFSSEGMQIEAQSLSLVLVIDLFVNTPVGELKFSTTIGGTTLDSVTWVKVVKSLNLFIDDVKSLNFRRSVDIDRGDILWSHDATWTLFHETLGHALEGDTVVKNQSFLRSSMGQKIAGSEISISDVKSLEHLTWYGYDDEGVKSGGVNLIEEGILTNYLVDRESSFQLKLPLTGNSRAGLSFEIPRPRQSNLVLEPGDFKEDELLSEVKSGMYIIDVPQAQINVATGEFILSPNLIREVKDGELGELLAPIRIRGNVGNILNKQFQITRSLNSRPVICEKEMDPVIVGSVSPSVKISNVALTRKDMELTLR